MNCVVLQRVLRIHFAHRHGPARKEARALIVLTIAALRRLARIAAARG